VVELRGAAAVRDCAPLHPGYDGHRRSSGGRRLFRFKCKTCDQWHEGMPSYGAEVPDSYLAVPEHERAARCIIGSDQCIIDEKCYFVRGCLEIPVHGSEKPFVYGVWVSLSYDSFVEYAHSYEEAKRAHIGPFFGWLNSGLALYPSTTSLKTMVHLRDNGVRPRVELEPTDHPLAVEQRKGIPVERVAEICAYYQHQAD
jgi:hypothetical protein